MHDIFIKMFDNICIKVNCKTIARGLIGIHMCYTYFITTTVMHMWKHMK